MSVVRFSNSTNLSAGLILSSSPQFREMSRVLNTSQTSREESFSGDLERELFVKTPSQYILDTEPSHLVYRLDQEMVEMDPQQIEKSTDDLSKLIWNVWKE